MEFGKCFCGSNVIFHMVNPLELGDSYDNVKKVILMIHLS